MVPESLGFTSGNASKLSPSTAASLGLPLHPDVRQSFAEFMGTQTGSASSLLPYNYLQLSKYWSNARHPTSLDSSSVTASSGFQGISSSTSSTSSSRSSSGVMDMSPRSQGSNNFHHQRQQLVSMMTSSSESSGNRSSNNVRRDSFSPDNDHRQQHCNTAFFSRSPKPVNAAAASVVDPGGGGSTPSSWDSLRSSGDRSSSVGHGVSHTLSTGSAFKPISNRVVGIRNFNNKNSSSANSLKNSSFTAENLIGINSRRSCSQDSNTPPPSESAKSGDNEAEEDNEDDDDEVDVIGDEANNNNLSSSFLARSGIKYNCHETSLGGSSGRCPSRRRDEDLESCSSSQPIEVSFS
jgi:hypothetical protein